MAVIKTIGKLSPVAYKQMIDHLTRKKIRNPFIKAEDIVVNKKPEIENMEAINRFVRDNPRTEKAGGGMLVQPGFDGTRQGYAGKKAPKVDNPKIKIFQHKTQEGKKYTGQPFVRDATKKKELPPNTVRRGEKVIFLGDNAMANAEAFSQTFKKKGGDINELRRLIDEANDGFKFVKIKDLQVKAGFSKDTSFLPKDNIYGSLDTMKDKAKKAFDYVFSDPNKPVKDTFDPMSQVKKLIGMSDKNAVGPLLQGYAPYEESKRLIKVLAVPRSKSFLQKAEGLTLGDLQFRIDNNIKGDNLFAPPKQVTAETKIMEIVDRHIKQGGKKIKWTVKPEITKGGYPSFGESRFVYNGKEYGMGELINEARNDPNFKEFFKAQRDYKTLNDKIVTNPKTGEKVRFGNLMKEVYGSSVVPYNIDHVKSIVDEPFTSLRILPARINKAAGNIIQMDEKFITNPELKGKYTKQGKAAQLKKIGYNFNQPVEDLIQAELKLADDVLNKGRNLRKPNQIVESIRKGENYVPDFYSKTAKPGPGFEKIIPDLPNQDLTRLARIGCPGKATGGRIGYFEGQNLTACAIKGAEKIKNDPINLTGGDQQNLRALANSAKAVRFLKNFLGPAAIAGELIFEGGFAANKFMSEGVPIKQALGESYINKFVLGPKTQIDVEAERAKEFAKGEEFAMAKRGERMAPFMAQSKEADAQRQRERMEQMASLYPQYSDQQLINMLEDAGYDSQDFINQQTTTRITPAVTSTLSGLDQLRTSFQEQDALQRIADAGGVANLAGGGIAKMAGVDSGPPPEKGPNSQGLPGLLKRVRNL